MAIKPIRLNVYSLAKKYSDTKENSQAVMRAINPIIKDTQVKREIGLRMIDEIIKRTRSGKDKNGNTFTGYSKAYLESTKFKVYKGSSKKVNLKLTGEMQSSIDVSTVENNIVSIFFDNEDDMLKAEGHVMGANYLPVRDFWGLPKEDDQLKIFENVIKEYNNETLLAKMEVQDSLINININDKKIKI